MPDGTGVAPIALRPETEHDGDNGYRAIVYGLAAITEPYGTANSLPDRDAASTAHSLHADDRRYRLHG
jgi:hypothetical protein